MEVVIAWREEGWTGGNPEALMAAAGISALNANRDSLLDDPVLSVPEIFFKFINHSVDVSPAGRNSCQVTHREPDRGLFLCVWKNHELCSQRGYWRPEREEAGERNEVMRETHRQESERDKKLNDGGGAAAGEGI